mmetsp:Transcript_29698/g.45538  ORF Transcript_29698/g.45538 Transcript_29698/m.45538 type:complete len:202 (+) Transcript_29698:756-1361(+)
MHHPAAASDFLSFVTSDLYANLTKSGFLKNGLVLYGDNAYVNTDYMAIPFSNVSSGLRDDYNFYYHSQVCINIECTFGIFTSRWRILKAPLPSSLSIPKVVALVFCLGKLHNFCLDKRVPEPHYGIDRTRLNDTSEPEDCPAELLDGGKHFLDISGGLQGAKQFVNASTTKRTPRDNLMDIVDNGNWKRQNRKRTKRCKLN